MIWLHKLLLVLNLLAGIFWIAMSVFMLPIESFESGEIDWLFIALIAFHFSFGLFLSIHVLRTFFKMSRIRPRLLAFSTALIIVGVLSRIDMSLLDDELGNWLLAIELLILVVVYKCISSFLMVVDLRLAK